MYTRWILSEESHWKINFDAVCFQDVSYTFSQKKKKLLIWNLDIYFLGQEFR